MKKTFVLTFCLALVAFSAASAQKFGAEGALFKKREELVKPIQDKVYAAIQKFAEDKGFEYIFDKGSASGMLYGDKKYDKTEDIKNLLKRG